MTKLAYRTLSNRMVGKLEVEKDTVFWDRELTGFGVRVYPTGSKVYIAQARGPEGPKRVAVGRQGVIHAEEARKRAALIISRIKAGEAPVPEPLIPAGGPSVAEFAARYLTEYVSVRCKPRTVKLARSVVHRHIAPALGKMPLAAVERAQVAELHQKLYETPAIANAVVGALSAMYKLAEELGTGPRGSEPLPLPRQIPRTQAGAVPDGGGVYALRERTGQRRSEGRRVGSRGGGDQALDTDRVPEVGDPHPSLGRRGAG